MPEAFIEHVNVNVANPDRTAGMLERLFGWQVRWEGPSTSGGRTIHVGGQSGYIAVHCNGQNEEPKPLPKGMPLNHIGIEVDDLDAVEARAIAAGMTPFNHCDYEPGRRFYLFDGDGIEWEIISYRAVRVQEQ